MRVRRGSRKSLEGSHRVRKGSGSQERSKMSQERVQSASGEGPEKVSRGCREGKRGPS